MTSEKRVYLELIPDFDDMKNDYFRIRDRFQQLDLEKQPGDSELELASNAYLSARMLLTEILTVPIRMYTRADLMMEATLLEVKIEGYLTKNGQPLPNLDQLC